ncbi:uncharacterized protein G2W53_015797 [Senna tora]|uniref:Uncharacterized protein n=1 Tax=Senna tora TaxID=362788 RepID=A0A834WW81_9FABA|nr:uncharacterized protein G2W53_015797 [Senna tora]
MRITRTHDLGNDVVQLISWVNVKLVLVIQLQIFPGPKKKFRCVGRPFQFTTLNFKTLAYEQCTLCAVEMETHPKLTRGKLYTFGNPSPNVLITRFISSAYSNALGATFAEKGPN